MHIQHIPNIHFTKLLKTAGRVREFNFRKLPGDNLFHTDVSDDRGNRIVFKIQKEGTHWHIVQNDVPQWIQESEKRLGELIDEELSSN